LVRDGICLFAPNPDGVRDDEVTVLVFRDAREGTILAVLFHFTCHPTVMGDYCITADYPGAARRVIERAFNGAAAGFLPGCFGDIRPNCTFIGGTKFRRGQPEDVALFGEALGNEVVRVAQEATDPPSRCTLWVSRWLTLTAIIALTGFRLFSFGLSRV
jgi:hypothetical protein